MDLKSVIVKPVITEKSLLAASKGKYTFIIENRADKDQVRAACKQYFNVDVTSVSTITTKGKTRRIPGRRQLVSIRPVKKAVVELAKGQTITLFQQWFSLEQVEAAQKETEKTAPKTTKKAKK